MNRKYKDKYRIDSTRLRYWNYGWNAAYFITICTKDREHYFGIVKNGEMQFSAIGRIAHEYWAEIPQHFPFVLLGEFVIMPNHMHGIVIIDKSYNKQNDSNPVETQNFAPPKNKPANENHPVETQNFASLRDNQRENKFGPQSKNLASIIRGYKSAVKKYATMHNMVFAWQPRYYDHIIRNEKSFYRITQYIRNNPSEWNEDKYFQ